MRSWFWVTIAGVRDLHYLVSANNVTDARLKVAGLSLNVRVKLATWGSVKKYLNARIPRGHDSDSPVRGSIPIECGDRQSYIHHSI